MAPVVGYWDIRGLAEPIRLLLHQAGVDFVDKRYQYGPPSNLLDSEFAREKPTLNLEFPNLPYYIDGDTKITQSLVIMRYLGKKHGFYPTTEADVIKAETLEQISRDIGQGMGFAAMKVIPPEFEELAKKKSDETVKQISECLGENDWLVGNKLTYVDFLMYETLSQFSYMHTDILVRYPVLAKYFKRMESLPKIHKYRTEGSFKEWPLYGTYMKWGGSGECPKRDGLL